MCEHLCVGVRNFNFETFFYNIVMRMLWTDRFYYTKKVLCGNLACEKVAVPNFCH